MWRGIVLVLLGFMAGVLINPIHVQGQTPDPCYYLTFTPSPQATHTTVVLPTATQSPSLTPTRDFSQAPLFQTATAIAKTRTAFPTPTEEVWTGATLPPATSTKPNGDDMVYRVITPSGVNIRATPNVNGNIVGVYRAGDYVRVNETQTVSQNGTTYLWGKTDKGWFAIRAGGAELAELRP